MEALLCKARLGFPSRERGRTEELLEVKMGFPRGSEAGEPGSCDEQNSLAFHFKETQGALCLILQQGKYLSNAVHV